MAHSPIFRAADIQWTGLIGWHGIIPTFSVGVAIGLASFSAVNRRSKKNALSDSRHEFDECWSSS